MVTFVMESLGREGFALPGKLVRLMLSPVPLRPTSPTTKTCRWGLRGTQDATRTRVSIRFSHRLDAMAASRDLNAFGLNLKMLWLIAAIALQIGRQPLWAGQPKCRFVRSLPRLI